MRMGGTALVLGLVLGGSVASACGGDGRTDDAPAEAGVGTPAPVADAHDDNTTSSDAVVDAPSDALADVTSDGPTGYLGLHVWSKRFGDNSIQGARVRSDAAGNVVVAGNFNGTINLGGADLTGTFDVFLAKFDKDGNHLWSKRFGDGEVQGVGALGVDASGGIFIGGGFDGTADFGGGALTSAGYDGYLAKFDATGAHVWSKSFGDAAYQNVAGLAFIGGDVTIIGENTGTMDLGGGSLSGGWNYLARFSGATGAHVWSRASSSGGFTPRSLAAGPTGVLAATGELVVGYPLDWGKGVLTSAGSDDVAVLKFDANGDAVWTKRFGDGQIQQGADVAVDAIGNIFVTGTFQSTLDFGLGPMSFSGTGGRPYVVKLGANGDALWNKSFSVAPGSSTGAYANRIAVDTFGNVVIGGVTYASIDVGGGAMPATTGVENLFVAKLDTSGKHLWSKGWASGAGGSNGSYDVAFDPSGNLLFLAGLSRSTIDMGGGPLVAPNPGAIALAKFGP